MGTIAFAVTGGCMSDYTPVARADERPKELQVSHSVGGTHWRTIVCDGTWFAPYGSSLLSLVPSTGVKLDEIACMPVGKSGALVDLIAFRGDLIGVLDRTAVIRIDITNPRALMVIETIGEKALGIRPESISVVGDELYVSGLGGIVRLDTGERFLAGSAVCGRVVSSAHGLVTTRNREIVSLADGSAIGRATDLQPLSSNVGSSNWIGFVYQGKEKARVGILDAELQEVAAEVITGNVSYLRELAGRLWAVTPTGATTWKIEPSALSDMREVRVRGAIDIDLADENTFAIAGTFGRSLYRFEADRRGQADEFFAATREPGRLQRVLSDGRRVVAGSDEGNWLYMSGGSCELSANPINPVNPPSSTVIGSFGTASIEGADRDEYTIESGSRVVVEGKGMRQILQMPQGAHARTLALVGDDLWIGNDDGIDVWRLTGNAMKRVGRLRLQGPVTNIYPRRTFDGATWVSLFGGMGVALWQSVDVDPNAPLAAPASTSAAAAK